MTMSQDPETFAAAPVLTVAELLRLDPHVAMALRLPLLADGEEGDEEEAVEDEEDKDEEDDDDDDEEDEDDGEETGDAQE